MTRVLITDNGFPNSHSACAIGRTARTAPSFYVLIQNHVEWRGEKAIPVPYGTNGEYAIRNIGEFKEFLDELYRIEDVRFREVCKTPSECARPEVLEDMGFPSLWIDYSVPALCSPIGHYDYRVVRTIGKGVCDDALTLIAVIGSNYYAYTAHQLSPGDDTHGTIIRLLDTQTARTFR